MTPEHDDPKTEFVAPEPWAHLAVPGPNICSGRQHRMWSNRLRDGFDPGSSVRLPEGYRKLPGGERMPASMHVTGDDYIAKIHLKQEAIQANMQTNAAAFEGWALALKRWAGAKAVVLNWEEPDLSNIEANPMACPFGVIRFQC